MKLQMSAQGGIYGRIEFEPIETENKDIEFPETLSSLIKSNKMKLYQEKPGRAPLDTEPSAEKVATDQQMYHLTVTNSDKTTNTYTLPQDVLASNPEIDQLVKFVWAHAKPISEQ